MHDITYEHYVIGERVASYVLFFIEQMYGMDNLKIWTLTVDSLLLPEHINVKITILKLIHHKTKTFSNCQN